MVRALHPTEKMQANMAIDAVKLSNAEGRGAPAQSEFDLTSMRPTILVVEDEQIVALDVKRHLASQGYVVVTVSSGEEALDNVSQSRPDLILMDIRLKGIDGIEAAQRIRHSLDVPIIYLTAYADQTTLSRARISEPYGYVLKPFDARALRGSIEMALQRHWSDRRRREREELQNFLADVSAQLAQSLDYEAVAGKAADLIVPRYAESCLVYIQQSDD